MEDTPIIEKELTEVEKQNAILAEAQKAKDELFSQELKALLDKYGKTLDVRYQIFAKNV